MLKIGYGEDTHRLIADRPLILGGVTVPFHLGLLGHSDADALIHAVMDAVIGALGNGDIGLHFPDSDDKYKGISSMMLLKNVSQLLHGSGYTIGNIDCTIIAQQPKLRPHIDNMCRNIADALLCDVSQVNVKATTPEGCNAEGNLECITARCVLTITRVEGFSLRS